METVSSSETATAAQTESSRREKRVSPDSGKPPAARVSYWASVKLTILVMSMIALTVLIGAWCPQESQVGRDKVYETFPRELADGLVKFGVSDIFHSPYFLFLIGMLTLNMVACSFQRVFPKIKTMKHTMPFLTASSISKLPFHIRMELSTESSAENNSPGNSGAGSLAEIAAMLAKNGFSVSTRGDALTGEYGKLCRLAATVTHIGLLSLLAGVTITSWTGFSGFQPVRLSETMSLADSEHSKLWIGKLPDWKVKVLATRRENYPSGEPKQWYSRLQVQDSEGKTLKEGEISVNNPLTYDGVDIYQSTWGLDDIVLSFNGVKKTIKLQPMGKRYAAFLPLDGDSVLIFSVLDTSSPCRLFAQRSDWQSPKLISEIKPGKSIELGGVSLEYGGVVPISGLQYKKDPGLPVVYFAFVLIMLGVSMAMIPYRQVWAALDTSGNRSLVVGGTSVKARVGFEKLLEKICRKISGAVSVDVVSTRADSTSPTKENTSVSVDNSGTNLDRGQLSNKIGSSEKDV